MIKNLFFIFQIIWLIGCAPVEVRDGIKHFTVPNEVLDQLKNAKECCESPSKFPYQTLTQKQTINIQIDKSFPAYTFESGKSYFVTYRLPDSAAPYKITIKSYFNGYAFYPAALLLDQHFNSIRLITSPEFHYEPPGVWERGHIEGTVKISGNEEKYIVVLTTSKNMELELHSTESGYAYATSTGAVMVPGGRYANHFGPIGNLELIIE